VMSCRCCGRLRLDCHAAPDRILVVSGSPPDRTGLPPARAAAPARVHGSVMVWFIRTN
jgi:hypothetical protein